ncbi:MAG: glycosyltransferase family 2 protein [Longimicrobiales bacterium]|nr:glycosyltransferase family 2 protein [Longimicrobiales bacterium]
MTKISRTPEEAAGALSDEIRRDFAVVVPAYDEAPVVPDLIRELRQAFEEYDLEGEVVLVDDGSTDGTAELAEREGKDWPALRVLRHRTNRGKTEAMLTALDATERSHLVLFDADLQHLPREIPRFLAELQEGWDIVTARKVGEYGKRAVSRIYNWLSRKIFDVPVSDMNSMKAFHRSVLEGLHLRHDWHRFFVVLAAHRGATMTEIDVPLHPRRAGRPKYSGRFRIVVGFLDLVSVWFLLAFSRKPLLLFGLTGAVLMALGVGVGLVAFYLRFVHELGFRPLLYLVILLETMGAVLLGVGLLAEMVAQLRDELDQLRGQVERES